WVAARLWWMLDDLGHERVVVLDGGWPGWLAAGGPVSTGAPGFPPARLHVRDRWTRVIDLDGLRSRLGNVVLLDARGAARYRGETEPIDAYPGHIPTARSAPTDANLAASGTFLPAPELAARYAALGAGGSAGEVVTACGSGVSACHTALAMRIAGLPAPLLYPGSYSDWSRHGLPVVTGPEPGSA
ncbi:MAG TPA: rhodanese-like domain-containing protein, partial [Candidatus Limnocylindrales bacterium]|nr:rhodanese-like domain-containing protein [Candidatus Limnocylindrales bacterium]